MYSEFSKTLGNEVESCRGVINRLLAEYVDALEHVNAHDRLTGAVPVI